MKKNDSMYLILLMKYMYVFRAVFNENNRTIHKPALHKLVGLYLEQSKGHLREVVLVHQKQVLINKIKEL